MDENEAKILVAEITAKSGFRTSLVAGLFGGLVAAVGTMAVGWFEFSARDKELDLELARISLGILAGDYDPEGERNPLPARRFAIYSLIRATGVSISDEDIETWVVNGSLPGNPSGYSTTNPYATRHQYLSFGEWNRDLGTPVVPYGMSEPGACVQHQSGVFGCGRIWSGVSDQEICVVEPTRGVICGTRIVNRDIIYSGDEPGVVDLGSNPWSE